MPIRLRYRDRNIGLLRDHPNESVLEVPDLVVRGQSRLHHPPLQIPVFELTQLQPVFQKLDLIFHVVSDSAFRRSVGQLTLPSVHLLERLQL